MIMTEQKVQTFIHTVALGKILTFSTLTGENFYHFDGIFKVTFYSHLIPNYFATFYMM